MQKLDPILSGLTVSYIIVASHPGNEMSPSGTVLSHITKGDDPPSVLRLQSIMTISRQAPWGVDWFAPILTLVSTEHHQATPLVFVLPHQAAQFRAIGGAQDEWFARVLALYFCHHLRF